MNTAEYTLLIKDNGGSRSGIDRRQLVRSESIPERRSGRDRREGHDRRSGCGQKRYHQNPGELYPVERRDQFRSLKEDTRNGKFASHRK